MNDEVLEARLDDADLRRKREKEAILDRDVCTICGQLIEPRPLFWMDGRPVHMLCKQLQLGA